MRDAAIMEIGIREVMTYCELAETSYADLADKGPQDPDKIYSRVHAFLAHCAAVARLAWSQEFAPYTGGKTLAQCLDVPNAYHRHQDTVREMVDHYDRRLARGLAARGEVERILDRNVGDRDAFEQEFSVFLRHYDPSVEASRSEQCRIENIWAISRRQHDDPAVRLEAVHLYQHLVEGLLAFIMGAADSRAAVAPHGVQLVNEHEAWRTTLGLVKEVTHAAGADTNKHLNEVAAADVEKRYVCFAGYSLCQVRLATTRRANQ